MLRILCPTDFSATANNAVRYAAQWASSLGWGVDLLHVMGVPAVDMYSPANILEEMMDQQRHAGMLRLEALSEQLETEFDCPFSLQTAFGFAAEMIVETAREKSAALICMGTTGTGSGIQSFLGSVSYEVSKHADRLVMVIPKEARYKEVQRTTMANDHKEDIDHSLDELRDLYADRSLEMHILTVHKGSDYAIRFSNQEKGVRIVEVNAPQVAKGICKYVDQNGVDLLALKRHQRGFLEDLLHKSTTKQVLGNSTIPVIIMN